MTAPDNPSAFPYNVNEGMSLRDYFAANIAVGMSSFTGTKGEGYGPSSIARRSYEISDAMLAERAKAPGQ